MGRGSVTVTLYIIHSGSIVDMILALVCSIQFTVPHIIIYANTFPQCSGARSYASSLTSPFLYIHIGWRGIDDEESQRQLRVLHGVQRHAQQFGFASRSHEDGDVGERKETRDAR